MKVINNVELKDLPKAAESILEDSHDIIGFMGDLGAGKTTLIGEICRKLGVKGEVSSPTFGIVNEYLGDEGPVYHFDLYRLKDLGEALDMGLTDYLDSGNTCLIEWPEIVRPVLEEYDLTLINIEPISDTLRRIFVLNS